MRAIIFSRDRAMQLHCLLDSLYTNADIFDSVVVIYKTDYYESYQIVKSYFPQVTWVEQGVFMNDVLKYSGKQYTCFMVDDDIIFKPINKAEVFAMMDECDIGSLRLGKNIRNRKHFEVKSSVDGNIFHNDLIRKLGKENFKNPNEMEITFAKYCKNYTMGWFNEQRLIGIPNNKVSTTSGCHHMGGRVSELDDMYCQGFRIDWAGMNLEYDNVHKDEQYIMHNIHKDFVKP